MQLIFSRLSEHREGIALALKDNDHVETIAMINGNAATYKGPVVVLGIDQHVVYGLSHPSVVSRTLIDGPQTLITSREMAHNMFEHGMKAALGKIRVKQNIFLANLETYYKLELAGPRFNVLPSNNGLGVSVEIPGFKPIVLCTEGYKHEKHKCISVDFVQEYLVVNLDQQ